MPLAAYDWVPMSSVPQRHKHYEGATTSTRRITGHLFGSLPVPTSVLLDSCSLLAALPGKRRSRTGPGSLFSRRSELPAHPHVDVSGTSQVSRRPILCLCPGLGSRPNRWHLAIEKRCRRCCPRDTGHEGFSGLSYRDHRGASAPAAYASRMMLPPSLQGSLPAGWLAFTGRESNPLDRDERFPSCYISSPFPGFILTLRHPKPVTKGEEKHLCLNGFPYVSCPCDFCRAQEGSLARLALTAVALPLGPAHRLVGLDRVGDRRQFRPVR